MPGLPAQVRDHGTQIARRLEQLPAHDSPETRQELAGIIRELVRMRDDLIEARRKGEDCESTLRAVNAVLSCIFGVEFPVAGLQWERLNETRSGLKQLLARE